MIDHTLLKPDATRAEIEKLCLEAQQFGFASVCVSPYRAAAASEILGKNSPVKLCTVVGFPHGNTRAEIKVLEVVRAISDGAREIDMVINLGAVKDGNLGLIENEIQGVVKAAKDAIVKVILETYYWDHDTLTRLCKIAKESGAHFVKTSTGFAPEGANADHVALMRKTVGPDFGVKASGGIRDLGTMKVMLAAGANRIGTSAGVEILSNLPNSTEDTAP
ncbi:MAG: deoxyribose-phosphate aldolase [Bdellovibrionales bacterium]